MRYHYVILGVGLLVACSDDETAPASTTVGPTSSTTTSSGTGGEGVGGDGGGATTSSGAGGEGGSGAGGMEPSCTAALEAAVGPVDEVSDGDVTILSDDAGVKEIWIDASAGGFQMAATNPWIYVDLGAGARVDVTDEQSFASAAWDLGLKRVQLRNNSLDGGDGDGATQWLGGADFASVSMADVSPAMLAGEDWFDDMCEYETDPTGALVTTFSSWYDYDGATMTVSPKDGVYIVRGGDGSTFYKVQILEYYANPDGMPGQTSGRYVLRVAAL